MCVFLQVFCNDESLPQVYDKSKDRDKYEEILISDVLKPILSSFGFKVTLCGAIVQYTFIDIFIADSIPKSSFSKQCKVTIESIMLFFFFFIFTP